MYKIISKRLRIPVYFLITGLVWGGVISDPLITMLFGHLNPVQQDTFRTLNDFVFVIVISIVLYIEIGNQQKKLNQSEEQYRELFESNPNPMWIYDKTTFKFVKVNNAAIAKYGYSKKKFLSMTIFDIRPSSEHKKLEEAVLNPKKGIKHSGTWEHLKSDGEIFKVAITSHSIKFEKKDCCMVMVTDMTDIINNEKMLNDAHQKIKSSNQVLLNVAWSNSHELRKPLCSMLSLVDLLKDATDEQEKKEYIELLQQCTKEMDDITKKNNGQLNAINID